MRESNIAEELGISVNNKKDVEKLFKDRQDERVELLKESIADIQNMIKEREQLNKELLNSLAKIELFIDNSIPKMETGSPADAELTKELLKKKIEVQEIKLEETLNVWRDVATLKKELREHMKEYRDMESKSTMIDTILEM